MTFPSLSHEQDYAIKGIMEDVNNDDNFGDVVEKLEWHSGGGLFHLLWRMTNGVVFAFHFQDSLLELSWDKWNSLQEYIDAPETLGEVGFGFEIERPNYDTRHWDIDNGDKEIVWNAKSGFPGLRNADLVPLISVYNGIVVWETILPYLDHEDIEELACLVPPDPRKALRDKLLKHVLFAKEAEGANDRILLCELYLTNEDWVHVAKVVRQHVLYADERRTGR